MFEYESDSSSLSPWLCILLLFGAPLACLIFGLFAADVFTELLRIVTKNRTAEVGIAYPAYGSAGFLLGYTAQLVVPRLYRSGGTWVWILPSGLLAWGVLDTLINRPAEVAALFGFPPYRSEALALAFLTWPTVATWFFSIGVAFASRPAATRLGEGFRRAIARSPLGRFAKSS
jgi:hypothetical protein